MTKQRGCNDLIKLFFHVGMPKTATSFLQDELFPRLKDIKYVERMVNRTLVHKIAYEREPMDAEKIGKKIRSSFSKSKSNLLSYEEVCEESCLYDRTISERFEPFRRLKEVLPETEIIMWIRGQAPMLISIYCRHVQEGGIKSLENFLWGTKKEKKCLRTHMVTASR